MNLYEYRERARRPDAASWDLVEYVAEPGVVVIEQRIEPSELERLKAAWLGRPHGTADRVG